MEWPQVEVVKDGRLVVLDGFSIVFFLHESHEILIEKVERALREYVRFVGLASLSFYIDDEGYTAPLSQDSLEHLLHRRFHSEDSGPESSITLLGSETGVSGYEFHYYGTALPVEGWPDYRNYMYCWFPRSFVFSAGFHAMRRFLVDLATFLPCSFAYGSPALLYHHEIGEATARAKRYPGFDVLLASSVAMELGDRVAGVYWLSILGPPLAAKCGGMGQLRSQLAQPISVEALTTGSVVITLDDEPEIGSANVKSRFLPYQALARVLQPFLHMPIRNYFAHRDGEPDREALEEWYRRYLSP